MPDSRPGGGRRKLRVAYVTTYAAADVREWSGLGHYIARALEGQGASVSFIGPLRDPRRPLLRAKWAFSSRLFRRRGHWNREPALLKSYARAAARRIEKIRPDVVFSPGSLPVAYLECEPPIAFWTDATFAGLLDYYPGFKGLSEETVRKGHAAEQSALDRAALAVYSSDWAAQTARTHYGVDERKLAVVPFGANLRREPSPKEVEQAIAARPPSPCRLLFVGSEWDRKGGDVAVEIARHLEAKGLETVLTVIGPRRLPQTAVSESVRLVGDLDKSTVEGEALLHRLMARSHFLVIPSRADCTPVVVSEAAAYGVPSLATAVGGMPTLIRPNVNGLLFGLESPASEYADAVLSLLERRDDYVDLARSTYEDYRWRLNWGVTGARVWEQLKRALAQEQRQACGEPRTLPAG